MRRIACAADEEGADAHGCVQLSNFGPFFVPTLAPRACGAREGTNTPAVPASMTDATLIALLSRTAVSRAFC